MGIVWKQLSSFGFELIKRSLVKRTLLTCSDIMLTQLQASQYIEIGMWQAEKTSLFFSPWGNQTGFPLPDFAKIVLGNCHETKPSLIHPQRK